MAYVFKLDKLAICKQRNVLLQNQIGNDLSSLVDFALPNMLTLLTMLSMLTLHSMFILNCLNCLHCLVLTLLRLLTLLSTALQSGIYAFIYCSMVRGQAHDGLREFYGIRVG